LDLEARFSEELLETCLVTDMLSSYPLVIIISTISLLQMGLYLNSLNIANCENVISASREHEANVVPQISETTFILHLNSGLTQHRDIKG
jgi:hypothetical protein